MCVIDAREIATGYRLSQWSQALQERKVSGESIKAFCQRKGVSRNTYFYWQRKLRESICQELKPVVRRPAGLGTVVPAMRSFIALSGHARVCVKVIFQQTRKQHKDNDLFTKSEVGNRPYWPFSQQASGSIHGYAAHTAAACREA